MEDIKQYYHGVLIATVAEDILRKTNLDKSFLIRRNDSGKQIVSYLKCGEVKHTVVPTKQKESDEILLDLVTKKRDDWCYPVTPNVPYDWNDANFKRPRGREHLIHNQLLCGLFVFVMVI